MLCSLREADVLLLRFLLLIRYESVICTPQAEGFYPKGIEYQQSGIIGAILMTAYRIHPNIMDLMGANDKKHETIKFVKTFIWFSLSLLLFRASPSFAQSVVTEQNQFYQF